VRACQRRVEREKKDKGTQGGKEEGGARGQKKEGWRVGERERESEGGKEGGREGERERGRERGRERWARPAEAPIVRGAAWIENKDATSLVVGAKRELADEGVRIRVRALDTNALAAGRGSPLLHHSSRRERV
jgi:hypothetical protein